MAFERAVQSLSFIEEKLRRAFNLAGPIGAKLEPVLTPVLIAGDLTRPGYASFQGRSWAWALNQGTPAGVSVLSLVFGADVLIESIYLTGQIGASIPISAYVTTPSEAVPSASALVAAGAWRDRKMLAGDVPPIQSTGVTFAALAGTNISTGNRVALWLGGPAGTSEGTERKMDIMIPAGGTLTFHSTNGSVNLAFGMYGRIWP